MWTTYPGTAVECSSFKRCSSGVLFDGIFATGGITLSQVCIITGLEPYLIQNWIKRGFVTPPKGRLYSREQLARIIIINMLRQSLQIDEICRLIRVISGKPDTKSDDLISDDELYHLYVDMIACQDIDICNSESVNNAALNATANFKEPMPGARKRLCKILSVMLYAHYSSRFADLSNSILSTV